MTQKTNSKRRAAAKPKKAAKVEQDSFEVRPLGFDEALASKIAKRRAQGATVGEVAQEFGIGAGKAAMAVLVAEVPADQVARAVKLHGQAARLAKAIAKDREKGLSWGALAARWRVTEGTARAAYEHATGQPFTALDYRKREGQS